MIRGSWVSRSEMWPIKHLAFHDFTVIWVSQALVKFLLWDFITYLQQKVLRPSILIYTLLFINQWCSWVITKAHIRCTVAVTYIVWLRHNENSLNKTIMLYIYMGDNFIVKLSCEWSLTVTATLYFILIL